MLSILCCVSFLICCQARNHSLRYLVLFVAVYWMSSLIFLIIIPTSLCGIFQCQYMWNRHSKWSSHDGRAATQTTVSIRLKCDWLIEIAFLAGPSRSFCEIKKKNRGCLFLLMLLSATWRRILTNNLFLTVCEKIIKNT